MAEMKESAEVTLAQKGVNRLRHLAATGMKK